jgi:hypothetical protein
MRRLVAALLAIGLVWPAAPPARAQTPPAGLPGHFALGVTAHPDQTGLYGWMPGSGVPWDYAYQYLTFGWTGWTADAQFPLLYARGAQRNGYRPVFPYYWLLQADGPCGGCGEAERDLAHLDDPALMARYYADFALLMRRLAAYDGAAIVQVEPDLSGYAQQAVLDNRRCYGHCTGQGNDPALLRAAVARSGNADVAAFPDSWPGFNFALLHLRDLYAPNVKLAFHVSSWATLQDIGSSSDPRLDASALGEAAGRFAASSGVGLAPGGVSTYDLVFTDVADRDAAYYKYVFGDASRWWDRQNVSFPNFRRWEQYIAAVVRATGRPAIVWQIPVGNQYYRSENNSDGHYQDNRVEYFMAHVDELVEAGVIGLLFGAGNGGSTAIGDARGDGVSNPPPLCTSDGLSSGQICADHESALPDDDGGYLRLAAQRYYASPRQLGAGPPVAPSTRAIRLPLLFRASG